MKNNISISNKKSNFDYEFIHNFTSGIILTGTEIKSIRTGKVSLSDSYCFIENGELFAKNVHIDEYVYGSYNNHDPKRDKKLLLNKKEINKIKEELKVKGISLIIKRLYTNERGYVKLDIVIAKGKREYEKRETIRERDDKREMDKIKKMNQ
ncbi:SsrA-binding protein SmpB [bacterium]|jgi:SsrA-binding protein|nr:SsrA-binding protein SmpB [bacterium]